MERTGLRDGDVVASRATPEAKNDDVVGAQFSNAMALKRFVPLDESHVKLRPDNHNPEHEPSAIDLAKHILHIDGVAVERSSGGWATQETIGPGRNPDTATLRR